VPMDPPKEAPLVAPVIVAALAVASICFYIPASSTLYSV
jgi:hypothetical protein